MKRDMELIRALLLKMESLGPSEPMPTDLPGYDRNAVWYHTTLLVEAGLLHEQPARRDQSFTVPAKPDRLTWAGHEFLDNARNEKAWKQVLGKARAAGVSLSLDVLKSLLGVAVKGMFE